MDEEIRYRLATLYQKSGVTTEELLSVLTEVSIQMLNERDKFLELGNQEKAREVHQTLARLYRRAVGLVQKEDRQLFGTLSDYWRRGGETFRKTPLPVKSEISPSKTKVDDAGVPIAELWKGLEVLPIDLGIMSGTNDTLIESGLT